MEKYGWTLLWWDCGKVLIGTSQVDVVYVGRPSRLEMFKAKRVKCRAVIRLFKLGEDWLLLDELCGIHTSS
jgi:hypothetical protein